MAKSRFAQNLDAFQGKLAAELKPLGFRVSGRNFNRAAEVGLVQVITLQMAQAPIGPTYEIPGLRENLYGKFTVELGVFVPEINRLSRLPMPAHSVQTAFCAVRLRLGELMHPRADRWWPLDSSLDSEVISLILEKGLPFLDRFGTRERIVQEWVDFSRPLADNPRASLDVALILFAQGKLDQARTFFSGHVRRDLEPSHRKYLAELTHELGVNWAV